MPPLPMATSVGVSLRACLETIQQKNGYTTELKAVFGPKDRVPEKPPMPYALVYAVADSRTGSAGVQATRERSFDIEVFFPKSVDDPEAALDAVHVDVLRALGFGQDFDRPFLGLIDENDEAAFRYAAKHESTHSITISIGVTYAETYN